LQLLTNVTTLFEIFGLPISLHCSEIFGVENLEIIERVHNSFLRRITKARKSTPMYMSYGELGRYPLSVIIKDRMISFGQDWYLVITRTCLFKRTHICCYKIILIINR